MQSLEELKANLAQYNSQAAQVKSLLALDPGNQQYAQLQSDLADAMRLTEQLIKTQTGGGGGGGGGGSAPAPAEPLQLRKEPAAAAAPSSEPWTPRVGDRVEAPYGEKRYPAVILALEEKEAGAGAAAIKYYGYPDVESKPLSDLTPLRPPPGGEIGPGQATVGFECEAKWIGDGNWYAAAVQGVVENGYKVKFTRYGNEAEVPLEYMKPRSAASASAASEAAGAAGRGAKRPAPEEPKAVKEFVIPDHLRLLPTDSEEDKARKRKKVKHLKGLWKQKHAGALEAREEEAAGGAGSWKDYLNKSKKKSATTKGLGALKKGSIFASPDTVEGRVGVVGSGQGVTKFESRNTFTKRNVMR